MERRKYENKSRSVNIHHINSKGNSRKCKKEVMYLEDNEV